MTDYFLLIPSKTPRVLKTASLVCERCGKEFIVPFWMVKKGRRFCNHACRKQNPMKTLLSRIEKQDNGCWNYTGCIDWGGYGQIKIGNTTWNAHKLMWILWNKKTVPAGQVVRHTCIGNRKCINPDHLILGTQKDNVQDMIRQGRFRIAVGTERPFAKLTEEQVRKIRYLRKPSEIGARIRPTYKELAQMFNVTSGIIWQVVHMKTYKNVSC